MFTVQAGFLVLSVASLAPLASPVTQESSALTCACNETETIPEPLPQQADHWGVVVKGRTIREWHDRAMDKAQLKPNREDAFRVLGQSGNSGAFALIQMLQASDQLTIDPNPRFGFDVPKGYVRRMAATTLGSMGQIALRAAPQLARMMRTDENVDVRAACAIAVGRLGSKDDTVVKSLKEVLRGEDYYVWQGAVFALGQMRPFDAETQELLTRIANADPYKIAGTGQDSLWAAVMNARTEARSALLPR
jgi:HEAT repeat protein